jgi:predicted metalloprotease with PDZ domain
MGMRVYLIVLIVLFSCKTSTTFSQTNSPHLQYELSIPQPENHTYHLEFTISHWNQDTICLKMPNWMPGYYQMMEYYKDLENISAQDQHGAPLPVERMNDNTWRISGIGSRAFTVGYTIRTHRTFVANSYVDADHAYLVPGNTFLYVDGLLQVPVSVKMKIDPDWEFATGLDPVIGKPEVFAASDFDLLYDCPILIGDLDELPAFKVKGINHRFIGYKMGQFDRELFMNNLKKVVEAAVDIMGEIPYQQYTFIGIGPGRGGIEHLNNTTVSFDGSGLDSPAGMNRMMGFLAHEYFHHYNVKRIRPYELGPFDYDHGSRTNLLWISEGFTVYYESLILKRAGLIDTETMLSQLAENLNEYENDPGRMYQSLSQASYNTWEEGPFGNFGTGPDRSISVYTKGAIVGMLLDFEIRYASGNHKSLDDVMRSLYWKYYIQEKRGFTDAEFQFACEQAAGISLANLFEYVYTTEELDYAKYLGQVGLRIDRQVNDSNDKAQRLMIKRLANPTPLQSSLLSSWLGE